METKYEELTREFISNMEAVGGPFSDFVEGLKHAESELRDRRIGAEEELRNMEDDS